MKKLRIIITVVLSFSLLSFVPTELYSQRVYRLYTENPAWNSALDGVSEIGVSTKRAFVGFEGAPTENLGYAMFSLKKKNVGISMSLTQYKVTGFDKTGVSLGYTYSLPNTGWNMGLSLIPNYSQFYNTDISYNYPELTVYNTKPMPGLDVSAGLLYSGESLNLSLAGRRAIIASDDLDRLDPAFTTSVLMDVGYKKDIFLLNVGTKTSYFDQYKNIKTVPIHLDFIVNILDVLQTGLIYSNPEGFSLIANYQNEHIALFTSYAFDKTFSEFGMQVGFAYRILNARDADEKSTAIKK